LLQLTFLRVHRARRRFQGGWPLRGWLFSIAARLRLDELRRRRNAQTNTQTLAGGEEEVQLPFEGDTKVERISLVQAVLEDLPESQRTVIHLHRYERMTFAEIAQLLGTTEGAIKLRAFRAYRRLRALLTPLLAKDDAA
jgi:RNA polymerase sigma factor (sigma-70 family)